ncbi:MAG TPA: hypothetical protein VG370_33410 [Chloroflexota bacterium]|nr:hypothetical protein [Chloroflexota bacterium]
MVAPRSRPTARSRGGRTEGKRQTGTTTPGPAWPPARRDADPDREARKLNRQAADALKKLDLTIQEEPPLVFRP